MPETDPPLASLPEIIPARQDDRCSLRYHVWRQSDTFGFRHMACRCGAVHPSDLAEFERRACITLATKRHAAQSPREDKP